MHISLASRAVEGFISLATAPTPSPTPSVGTNGLRPGLTADMVSPGLLGFVMTAFMVIAVVALMVSMTRRIRRVRYAEQVREDNLLKAGEGSGSPEGA